MRTSSTRSCEQNLTAHVEAARDLDRSRYRDAQWRLVSPNWNGGKERFPEMVRSVFETLNSLDNALAARARNNFNQQIQSQQTVFTQLTKQQQHLLFIKAFFLDLSDSTPIKAKDSSGNSMLHNLATFGFLDLIQYMRNKSSEADIMEACSTNDKGFSPLDLAILCGHTQIFEYMISDCSMSFQLVEIEKRRPAIPTLQGAPEPEEGHPTPSRKAFSPPPGPGSAVQEPEEGHPTPPTQSDSDPISDLENLLAPLTDLEALLTDFDRVPSNFEKPKNVPKEEGDPKPQAQSPGKGKIDIVEFQIESEEDPESHVKEPEEGKPHPQAQSPEKSTTEDAITALGEEDLPSWDSPDFNFNSFQQNPESHVKEPEEGKPHPQAQSPEKGTTDADAALQPERSATLNNDADPLNLNPQNLPQNPESNVDEEAVKEPEEETPTPQAQFTEKDTPNAAVEANLPSDTKNQKPQKPSRFAAVLDVDDAKFDFGPSKQQIKN